MESGNSLENLRVSPTYLGRLSAYSPKGLKHDHYWRRVRTVRQGIVIAVVVAFATVESIGAIRVMTPGSSVPETAATSPAVHAVDEYDDDSASQDSPGELKSP